MSKFYDFCYALSTNFIGYDSDQEYNYNSSSNSIAKAWNDLAKPLNIAIRKTLNEKQQKQQQQADSRN
jgi:hypothetical protein